MRVLTVTAAAVLSCLIVAAIAWQGALSAQMDDHPAPTKADAKTELRQTMRKLWSDHIFWERSYIVSAVADSPDKKAVSDRLMRNQEDIGAAVAGYYGKEAGDKLTTLLKEHITLAVDLIEAAKAKDEAKKKDLSAKRERNGEDIADFLSKANPNWPRATLVEMMKMHLSTSGKQLTARLAKDWAADVEAFDGAYDHVMEMADALSDGIIKQFPDKFR